MPQAKFLPPLHRFMVHLFLFFILPENLVEIWKKILWPLLPKIVPIASSIIPIVSSTYTIRPIGNLVLAREPSLEGWPFQEVCWNDSHVLSQVEHRFSYF